VSWSLSALAAVVLVAFGHLLAPWLRFLRMEPRSRFLSVAGGVSVAYVFVHLLPEIAAAQAAVDDTARGVAASFERHAYVAALAGLALFYGLERAAVIAKSARHPEHVHPTPPAVFWITTASFAAYNVIIGYLLVEDAAVSEGVDLALFALALALHMVVNDLGLRHHHRARYDRWGRWVLAAAPIAGYLLAQGVTISEAGIGLVIAFLGGGVVLNVLKEELPEERLSRFGAFVAGAAGYAALLLAA
jgi:hypothetical protein